MLLTAVRDEFAFYNECRKLSPLTIKSCGKQAERLHNPVNFTLNQEKSGRYTLKLCEIER